MPTGPSYAAVTALEEATSARQADAVLAGIRQPVRIPLVNSIWRGLAGMVDSLSLDWAAAKPIYESGELERALTRSVATVGLSRLRVNRTRGPEPQGQGSVEDGSGASGNGGKTLLPLPSEITSRYSETRRSIVQSRLMANT